VTLGQILDRAMDRLNLSSDVARARLTSFVNERTRKIQTSCSLSRVRLGTVTAITTSGTNTLVPSGIIKPITVFDVLGNRALGEQTLDQLRNMDPNTSWSGRPSVYAVRNYGAADFTLQLAPMPDDAYELTIDGVLLGGDMVDETEIPGFPEDFHDALVFGTMADEYYHFDKPDHAQVQEQKYEERVRALRYFMSKSAYNHQVLYRTSLAPFWWVPPSNWYTP
jgi:hypothetical protein